MKKAIAKITTDDGIAVINYDESEKNLTAAFADGYEEIIDSMPIESLDDAENLLFAMYGHDGGNSFGWNLEFLSEEN